MKGLTVNRYHPVDCLQSALFKALRDDLPEEGDEPLSVDQVDVELFSQRWPTTALGFMCEDAEETQTKAPTVIITHMRKACVYFGERLAYTVDAHNRDFLNDMEGFFAVGQEDAFRRYGAKLARPE
ncbi:hypothetical protein [Salipiger sp. PrR003]|uniref:hypothetical protein n=1 Tax=Salipiger sp. PrR003 TaxID=2706776 RepID=UPI0013DD66E7|nr:hypothetical protein [Salipiger sp. PrR003]NDV50840.1 hypothetical protein [Salipiger sp. PrR003]